MEEAQPATGVLQISFKKRNVKAKPTLRKRGTSPSPTLDTYSSFESSEDENGRQIKRRKKSGGLTASSATHNNDRLSLQDNITETSLAQTAPNNSEDATRSSTWYDEKDIKAMSKLDSKREDIVAPDGTYKGVANYSNFIQKNPDRAAKQVGPVKSSSNVRTITTTDFAPDVCKDYKQTGFCGFGDSCKFLHAREDYKQGWALDRDWEIQTKGKKVAGKTVASANRNGTTGDAEEEDDALLESIPFACVICKGSYKNPVVTRCGHYFCEKCALYRYRDKRGQPSCAACGADTGGVFNVAKKLNKLLERKRERAKRLEEKEKEKQAD